MTTAAAHLPTLPFALVFATPQWLVFFKYSQSTSLYYTKCAIKFRLLGMAVIITPTTHNKVRELQPAGRDWHWSFQSVLNDSGGRTKAAAADKVLSLQLPTHSGTWLHVYVYTRRLLSTWTLLYHPRRGPRWLWFAYYECNAHLTILKPCRWCWWRRRWRPSSVTNFGSCTRRSTRSINDFKMGCYAEDATAEPICVN